MTSSVIGKQTCQWMLLSITLPLFGVLLWWPNLLMADENSLGHGYLSLILAGLCLALTCGVGMFQNAPTPLWWLVHILSVAAVAATLYIILMIN